MIMSPILLVLIPYPILISTTYERLMQNPDFREWFEANYQEFVLSEMVLQLMEQGKVSVRELATAAEVSPRVIQEIRSGNRVNITLLNLSKNVKTLVSRLVVQTDNLYV